MEYLNGWTKESVTEHVKTNFKGRSMSPYGNACYYRGKDSKKCIAGCFIPDKQYESSMEGTVISTLIKFRKEIAGIMPFNRETMLDWQVIHDDVLTTEMTLEVQLEHLLAFLDV